MRRTLLMVLAVAGLVAGCSSSSNNSPDSGSLPDASGLLKDSAAGLADIKSAHFTLTVNGNVSGISVQHAEGDLTREGAAKGTVKLTLLGQLIEGEFVLVDDSVYLKGPTGGYQKLPASMISNVYDPSAILDPSRGVAHVLDGLKNAKTQAKETVEGVSAYKITGKATKNVVSALVPGVDSDVDVTIWLAESGRHQPVKATVSLPGADGKPATVDLTLSDVDKPVTITAPN